MLHVSQITPDYRYNAMAMAGALIREVGHLFPQHMILVYMTLSHKRRQVLNCVIASMFANPDSPQPITDPDAIREKLLNTSSKELLQEAYGSVPEGMVQALGRLELKGQESHIYLLMHKFMSESATLRKSFSHASKINASTITTLAALPRALQSYDLASQFRDPEDIKAFLFMIDMMTKGDEGKYKELCANVVNAAKGGHSVVAVLKREYELTPFQEPAVPSCDQCRHINNAFDLRKAALQFKSCLKQFVPEAIRDEYQYYCWFENQRPFAVISLRQDHPYGWRVEEIRGTDNLFLDDEDESKIIQYFESHGVYKMVSMEGMLRELGGMLNRGRRRDPMDGINDVIDELLEDQAL